MKRKTKKKKRASPFTRETHILASVPIHHSHQPARCSPSTTGSSESRVSLCLVWLSSEARATPYRQQKAQAAGPSMQFKMASGARRRYHSRSLSLLVRSKETACVASWLSACVPSWMAMHCFMFLMGTRLCDARRIRSGRTSMQGLSALWGSILKRGFCDLQVQSCLVACRDNASTHGVEPGARQGAGDCLLVFDSRCAPVFRKCSEPLRHVRPGE